MAILEIFSSTNHSTEKSNYWWKILIFTVLALITASLAGASLGYLFLGKSFLGFSNANLILFSKQFSFVCLASFLLWRVCLLKERVLERFCWKASFSHWVFMRLGLDFQNLMGLCWCGAWAYGCCFCYVCGVDDLRCVSENPICYD